VNVDGTVPVKLVLVDDMVLEDDVLVVLEEEVEFVGVPEVELEEIIDDDEEEEEEEEDEETGLVVELVEKAEVEVEDMVLVLVSEVVVLVAAFCVVR
jgi:hypothetical protein